jgi:hypothetical protein
MTALTTTAGEHGTTCGTAHALAETMLVGALAFAGLVGTFHRRWSFLRDGKCRPFPFSDKHLLKLPSAGRKTQAVKAIRGHIPAFHLHE